MREHKSVLNEFKWTQPEKKEPVSYKVEHYDRYLTYQLYGQMGLLF